MCGSGLETDWYICCRLNDRWKPMQAVMSAHCSHQPEGLFAMVRTGSQHTGNSMRGSLEMLADQISPTVSATLRWGV